MTTRSFLSAAEANGALYWMTRDAGDLVKYDIANDELEYLLPTGEMKVKDWKFSAVAYADEASLYAFLNSGRYLMRYDLQNRTTKIYRIDRSHEILDWLICVIKEENKLIVLSCGHYALLTIDLETGDVRETALCEKREGGAPFTVYLSRTSVCRDGKILCVLIEERRPVSYDIKTEQVDEIELPSRIGLINDMVPFGEKLLVINGAGEVFSWDIGENTVECVVEKLSRSEQSDAYGKLCVVGETLWIFPRTAKEIYRYDLSTKDLTRVCEAQNEICTEEAKLMGQFPAKVETDEYVFLSVYNEDRLAVIDKKTNKLEFREMRFDAENFMRFKQSFGHRAIKEKEMTLKQFIEV